MTVVENASDCSLPQSHAPHNHHTTFPTATITLYYQYNYCHLILNWRSTTILSWSIHWHVFFGWGLPAFTIAGYITFTISNNLYLVLPKYSTKWLIWPTTFSIHFTADTHALLGDFPALWPCLFPDRYRKPQGLWGQGHVRGKSLFDMLVVLHRRHC